MILDALSDHWQNTSHEGYLMAMASGLVGVLAHVEWGAAVSVLSVVVTAVGGTGISLWKSYKLARIEIEAKQRKLAAPPPGMVPDERASG
jgi:hypothetical protein